MAIPRFPEPTDPLDAAVRRHLDRAQDGPAADRIVERALAALDADCPVGCRPRRRRLELLPLAAAATLLLALFAVSPRGHVQAAPAEVVRLAQRVHQAAPDLHYSVRTEASESLRRRFPRLDFRRDARLWTRGDRFWVEPALAGKGRWGRDEHGRLWLVPTPDAALRYDPDEVPEPLALFAEVRAVRLPTLLADVLRDCDLSLDPAAPAGVRIVLANPRPGTGVGFGAARIEIEEETGLVRALTLRPRFLGREVAQLNLVLLSVGMQPDESYRAEGHLAPGSPVYERSRPRSRQQLLLRALVGADTPSP